MEVWVFVDYFLSLENQHINISTKWSLLFDPFKNRRTLVPSAF